MGAEPAIDSGSRIARLRLHTCRAAHDQSAQGRSRSVGGVDVSRSACRADQQVEIIAAIKPMLYHPVVLSKMALQIEQISCGRFAINLVNAWNRPEIEKAGVEFAEHDEWRIMNICWLWRRMMPQSGRCNVRTLTVRL